MAEAKVSPATGAEESSSLIFGYINEVITSPLNLTLVAIIAFLVYKIFKSKTKQNEPVHEYKELPKMKRDFTLEELKEYDGLGPDGRILMAVNGNVYDVTKGARFYGPGMLSYLVKNFCSNCCAKFHAITLSRATWQIR